MLIFADMPAASLFSPNNLHSNLLGYDIDILNELLFTLVTFIITSYTCPISTFSNVIF